jgi:anaerobic magnesium-protoporphyrin IX monomethyl ester cyclase
MDYPEIDYVVVGEGEITLLELVKALRNGHDLSKIKGIAFRQGKNITITPERPLIEDLDTIPMPAYHKLPMEKYRFIVWGREMCIMLSSRGCPFTCRFCTEPRIWRNRWRGRSARKVVDEMELLKTKYGINVVWFGDDCFNLDRKRNEQFIEELEQRKLDMKWFIEARVDTILRDADLAQQMSKSGLFYVLMGAESSSENDLKYLNKNINLSQTKKAVAVLKKHDVIAQACFIVGLPDDTKNSIKRTINFAKSLDPDIAVFTPLTPFPGTGMYDELAGLGLLTETEFKKFDYLTPVARTRSLSRRQLQREMFKAYVQFYGRPLKIVEAICSRKRFLRKIFIHMLRSMATFQLKQYVYDELSDTQSNQKLAH